MSREPTDNDIASAKASLEKLISWIHRDEIETALNSLSSRLKRDKTTWGSHKGGKLTQWFIWFSGKPDDEAEEILRDANFGFYVDMDRGAAQTALDDLLRQVRPQMQRNDRERHLEDAPPPTISVDDNKSKDSSIT